MNGHSNYHSGKIIYSSNIALNKGRGTGKLLFNKHFFFYYMGEKDNRGVQPSEMKNNTDSSNRK